MSIGIGLEHAFKDLALDNPKRYAGYKNASEVQDFNEGTDLFWYGQRMDITLMDKHCLIIGEIHGCVSVIKICVRIGNSVVQFKDPVIVLHSVPVSFLDGYREIELAAGDITPEVLDKACDIFYEWQDAQDGLTA